MGAQELAQRQSSEEPLDAVPRGTVVFGLLPLAEHLIVLAVLRVLVALTSVQHVLQGGRVFLTNHPPRVCGTLVGEGHLDVPEQAWPQSAFDPNAFDELQATTASEVICSRMLLQKLVVLSHEVGVGRVVRGHQEVVGGAGLSPHVRILAAISKE